MAAAAKTRTRRLNLRVPLPLPLLPLRDGLGILILLLLGKGGVVWQSSSRSSCVVQCVGIVRECEPCTGDDDEGEVQWC